MCCKTTPSVWLETDTNGRTFLVRAACQCSRVGEQANCGGAKGMDHFPRLYPESLRAD